MSHRHFDIDELSDEERLSLVDDIYDIYKRLFHGWSKNKLMEVLSDRSCKLFKARIFLNPQAESIGFVWLSSRTVQHRGKPYTIFHNMGGLDASVRKSGLITSFFTGEIVRYRLTHPFETIYCVQRLIHPASYCAWINAMPVLYPKRDMPTPTEVTDLTAHLLDVFQYKVVDANNPFVVETDNHVMLTPQEKRRWLEKQDKDVAFFYQLTGGRDEHAMVAIFPLTFTNLALSVWTGFCRRFKRKLSK